MVNVLQISSSKNPYGENRWYSIYLCVGIASSKTLYEKPQTENSHKEKSAMHVRVSSTKNPMGKMDDMTWPCVDIGSLKTLYEKPQEKNS